MGDIKTQLLSYVFMVWHRRWIALAVAWLVCVIGWPLVAMLPNAYQATARIFVDTDTMLRPLLRGLAIENDMRSQLEIMQRTLLSRPNLESVMRMTDLDVTADTPEKRDELLRDLERKIRVGSQQRALFSVAYEDKDPNLAKRVVQSLLTIFVESNLGTTRTDLEQARRFIDNQIQQYERQLRAAEERIGAFKQRNLGLLPEGGNFSAKREQARAQLAQLKNELDDSMTRRSALQEQLASLAPFIEVDNEPQTQVFVQGAAQQRQPTQLEMRIAEIERSIDGLLMRFTPKHPDVLASQRILEQLKQQRDQEAKDAENAPKTAGAAATGTRNDGRAQQQRRRVPNQVYDQTRLRLIDLELVVQSLQRRYSDGQAELARLDQQAKTALALETEYLNLDRDYSVLKTNYDQLLTRREQARIGQEADARTDKVQFRIIDPPTVPLQPSSPNRPLLFSAILLGGFAIGVAVAFLFGFLTDSFSTTQSLRNAFALPILGSVSRLSTAFDRRRRLSEFARFGVACVTLVGAYGAIMLYLLRVLPPELLRFIPQIT